MRKRALTRWYLSTMAVVGAVSLAGVGLTLTGITAGASPEAAAAPNPPPASPPVTWCETGLPTSPYALPPAGAVTIPAGDDSNTAIVHEWSVQPNTTYWFAPGVHTVGVGQYAQIAVADGDVFVGAPGAIIDGQGSNNYAFSALDQNPSSAIIEYLTIQHFMASSGEAVVGQGGYNGWTIQDNLIQNNPLGAGVAVATNGTVTDNCLYDNGEYGFNGWGGSSNVTLTDNDIAFNNTAGYYDVPGSTVKCGCSGGGKFWQTTNATVTGNYVHNNVGVGIWVDTNNAGFDISGNYLSDNWGQAIAYEISYNARITNNTVIGNGIGEGETNATPGFPDGAIYISESGADPRVASNFNQQFLVAGNVLTNNWGGVVLWENANRYCSDGSDGVCTLVNPSVYTLSSCAAHLSEQTPVDFYDNCRWKTQNVLVTDNFFNFSPSAVGSGCNTAFLCGFNGLFSNYGNLPYAATRTVAVTFQQNNLFTDNTYNGPWQYFAWSQSNLDNPVTWAQWTGSVTDMCAQPGELASGACASGFGQDAGSTLNPTPPPPTAFPVPPPEAGGLAPVTAARILDTRTGLGATGPLSPGQTISLAVLGQDGVPAAGVGAVALNLTVTAPSTGGYVTAFADGTSHPGTANLNFSPGATVANLVIAPVGADGEIDIINNSPGTIQLVADLNGWFALGSPVAGGLAPVTAARILDTRTGLGATGPVSPGQTISLAVLGQDGVPAAGVGAVALNLTVTAPSAGGYVTAFADGTSHPGTANLNFNPGATVANLVIAPVGADGEIDITNNSPGTIQLVADLSGSFVAASP